MFSVMAAILEAASYRPQAAGYQLAGCQAQHERTLLALSAQGLKTHNSNLGPAG
jgi:hypothetical protein